MHPTSNALRAPSSTASTAKAALFALAAAVTVAPLVACSSDGAAGADMSGSDALSGPCGGAAIPKAGGGNWECTFDDEFNGTALDTTKWTALATATSGYHSGIECYFDSPNNVSVSGGALNLTARQEAAPFVCKDPTGNYTTQYSSGTVNTFHKFSQTFGRYEVRARVLGAKVQGLQESFWLWPDNDVKYGPRWPESGEIDIAEIYHKYPDRAIPYIHYVPASYDVNVTNNYCMISDIAQFHTYAAEWTPSTIKIIFDGQTCLTDNWNPRGLVKPAPFDQPFFVVLTQALGITTNSFDPKTTPLPAVTQVDYVRVWK